jgi:carbon-monoxide dehydrogenase medium subunit
MEQALHRDFSVQAIAGLQVSSEGLNDDLQADPAYRAHLVTQMAIQAVGRAVGRPFA